MGFEPQCPSITKGVVTTGVWVSLWFEIEDSPTLSILGFITT